MGRRERRGKQLLDDLRVTTGYWKLKEEALDRTYVDVALQDFLENS
jgi:hypothetical protein